MFKWTYIAYPNGAVGRFPLSNHCEEVAQSDPRRRICKRQPSSKSAEKNDDSQTGAARGAAVDANLVRIIAAWRTLGKRIQRAIMALIE
jgi:hypothetical protein